MYLLLRFIFGLAIGSFLNVLAVRYDPNRFLFARPVIGGRSRCPKCRTTLQWFELVPLLSYLVLRGKCRTCHDSISVQYPLVEFLSGLIFIFVPTVLRFGFSQSPIIPYLSSALWILFFELLLLLSLVDFRLKLIPDEISIMLFVVGFAITIVGAQQFGLVSGSFIGNYAALFGLRDSLFVNRLVASTIGAAFFFLIALLTRGRGMGLGDVKLMIPLGLAFGWPDIAILSGFAFILGSIVGIIAIAFGGKTRKSTIPFGPFLAFAALLIFFFGTDICRWYFSLFIG